MAPVPAVRRATPAAAAPVVERKAPARGVGLLALQRAAGNRAVARLLGAGGPVVQRHNSWEHALLGDTPPKALGKAAVSNANRKHVLSEEYVRMNWFRRDPFRDPTARFRDVRWLKLRASGLWVSYGELNALGDYLADPTAYDTLPASQLVPVLQTMRAGILAAAGAEFGLHGDDMAGAVSSLVPGAAGEVKALDEHTAGLGLNRYKGLVARNACHFAPLSWERWSLFHNEAADEARLHYESGHRLVALNVIDTSAREHNRQAMIKNGYADHFLQDSFAAGHLANKTLMMQWFVDYLNGLNWLARPWFGLPADSVMSRMGSARQPGVTGMERYGRAPTSEHTSEGDRLLGSGQTDPQTAQERDSYAGRVSGSGVGGDDRERDANYQAYLGMLNSAFLQLAAGAVHDYLNEHGLSVLNQLGTEFKVGGDDTLLSKSDELGAQTAGAAAHMSRDAIEDLLLTGQTDKSVEKIFALVPQSVRLYRKDGTFETFGLGDFQVQVLHRFCDDYLFPDLTDSWKGRIVRKWFPDMVSGGISQDAGRPAPRPAVGDFVTTAESAHTG
jgi:hypothetical protein